MNRGLEDLVWKFRVAIEKAKVNKEFVGDLCFNSFPYGCCGPTSCMLAKYLHKNGIDTIYVCGWRGEQFHAWLVLKDKNVREAQRKYIVAPEEIKGLLNLYSVGCYNEPVDITHYEAEDINKGLIIDITADQFSEMKNCPMYIDFMDSFHNKFEFEQAHDYVELKDTRLGKIYDKICRVGDIELVENGHVKEDKI